MSPGPSDLRLCIDAVPLLVRSAGIKNYLYHWVTHLRQARGEQAVRLFPYVRNIRDLDHERSIARYGSTLLRLTFFHLLNRTEKPWLDWTLPAADVFHAAKLLHPPRRARLTATLHDATCWLMPELHTPANVEAERRFTERVLRRADGLIAVSGSTRDDCVRLLGLDPKRIRVIHHGIAEAFFQPGAEQAEGARRRYGLARPYILFVGTIEPRKNVAALLDAYESLPADVREEFEVVIAGPVGWMAEPILRRLQAACGGVRRLGYVPEAVLPGLFAGASVFAYVSLYEGFGFPVAQALAAGAPVLTSAVSSLPEIAGDAAELVDPRSVAAIRAALCRLLTSPSRRRQLVERGYRRARHFRWQRNAEESLRFFEETAGR